MDALCASDRCVRCVVAYQVIQPHSANNPVPVIVPFISIELWHIYRKASSVCTQFIAKTSTGASPYFLAESAKTNKIQILIEVTVRFTVSKLHPLSSCSHFAVGDCLRIPGRKKEARKNVKRQRRAIMAHISRSYGQSPLNKGLAGSQE